MRSRLKDIRDVFRGLEPFSFEGINKWENGALFLTRFACAIDTHKHETVRRLDFGGDGPHGGIPDLWNKVIYQALLNLCKGDAVKIVTKYPEDGWHAFTALRRRIMRGRLTRTRTTLTGRSTPPRSTSTRTRQHWWRHCFIP